MKNLLSTLLLSTICSLTISNVNADSIKSKYPIPEKGTILINLTYINHASESLAIVNGFNSANWPDRSFPVFTPVYLPVGQSKTFRTFTKWDYSLESGNPYSYTASQAEFAQAGTNVFFNLTPGIEAMLVVGLYSDPEDMQISSTCSVPALSESNIITVNVNIELQQFWHNTLTCTYK